MDTRSPASTGSQLSGSVGTITTGTILGGASPTWNGNGGTYTIGYSFTPNANLLVTDVLHDFGTKISVWTNSGVLVGSQIFACGHGGME